MHQSRLMQELLHKIQDAAQIRRLRICIRGAVQGVGFRPFVYRLARGLDLTGWVNNSCEGVFIEAEGPAEKLQTFLLKLQAEKPPRAFIASLEPSYLNPAGYAGFEIRESIAGDKTAIILPDIATCSDCLQEIFDPSNRRYLYPFTNCTHCGPRFSIVEDLPYDRARTTMKSFVLCQECQAEFDNPADRRFHAQANACPDCGPHVELWDGQGHLLASYRDALVAAARALRDGKIVALKGIGGFQLLADARNENAVRRLRLRKHREEKPFALMMENLQTVQSYCQIDPLEERLLTGPEAPIVLLSRKPPEGVVPLADNVAPDNPYLGVMLPYSPLHHLLLRKTGFSVIATSGNISDEPICIEEREVLEHLKGIADLFLVHDRPIVRPVDDSIVRLVAGSEMVLRRARGYAPLPIAVLETLPAALAVGGHLKNTVALAIGKQAFVSQHVGDLETPQALDHFARVTEDFGRMYEKKPALLVCDLHPRYASTQFARESGLPVIAVQHHYAHVLACMAENGLQAPALGVAWDGTGYGTDGTIWGGEFLRISEKSFSRAAHLRTFRLPGGEAAIREPRRAALGILHAIFGEDLFERQDLIPLQTFSQTEREVLRAALSTDINVPITSSAGRLFDAVASITGLCQRMKFEGQAAMALEFTVDSIRTDASYDFCGSEILDWEAMIRGILQDLSEGVPRSTIAAKFHSTLAEMIVAVAKAVGEECVVLSGGCFQNKVLSERTTLRLRQEGFRPAWHQRIPPNDGGIALGQLIAAARQSGACKEG